jgi:hypothetical protein
MNGLFTEEARQLKDQFACYKRENIASTEMLGIYAVRVKLCATVLQLYTIKPRSVWTGPLTRSKDPKIRKRLLRASEDIRRIRSKMDKDETLDDKYSMWNSSAETF